MSKTRAKALAFSAIVLITVIGAVIGVYMPEAAPAGAVGAGAFALANAVIEDYHAWYGD